MTLWLADAAYDHAVNDALQLIGTGMVVVFSALLLLLLMVTVINRLFPTAAPKTAAPKTEGQGAPETSAPAAPPPMPAVSTATGGTGVVDQELIAVLTAAATVALQKRVRVSRIRFIDPKLSGHPGWVVQGRAGILGSHRPQRRRR